MKKSLYLILTCGCIFGCNNEDEPQYPAEPFIEFKKVEFFDDFEYNRDAISLTFSYRDGDHDLGLNYDELDSPYHEVDLFLEDGENLIRTKTKRVERETYDYYFESENFQSIMRVDLRQGQSGKLVTIRTKEKEPFVFLPDDLHCVNYSFPSTALLVFEEDEKFIGDAHIYDTFIAGNEKIFVLADTFYHQINESVYNITVDFWVEQPDGSYTAFDWYQNFCASYDGRFPQIPFIDAGPFKQNRFPNGKVKLLTQCNQSVLFPCSEIKR